jgi:hypothetical protein
LVVLSFEPETIFSFDGIISNELVKPGCPVKVAMG